MGATVHWKSYSKKPDKKPSKRDLTTSETMRQYGSATYHNTGSKKGMTESIVFDKSHAVKNGGTYIYTTMWNAITAWGNVKRLLTTQ